MLGRNKVIKGLKCCLHLEGLACLDCPYDADAEGIGMDLCTAILHGDALDLIKAQKPRVLKETKSRNKGLYVGWVLAYEVQTGQGITGDCLGMAEPSGRMVWYKLGDYSKTWRCWNKLPTDEQREKVAWDAD